MEKIKYLENEDVTVYGLKGLNSKTGHGAARELISSRLTGKRTGVVYIVDASKHGIAANFLKKTDDLNYHPKDLLSAGLSTSMYMQGEVLAAQANIYADFVEFYIEVKPTY